MVRKEPKIIFVTGGVISGIGKGVTASSIGTLLKSYGFKIRNRKIDMYLNVDPGTMSPDEHGEVFVTEDGVETDLDLGHYERFTRNTAKSDDITTLGSIYQKVIKKEREGGFLGATVQLIPHVTDAIIEFICNFADEDFIIYEIGGAIGDIEGQVILEAIRQIRQDKGAIGSMIIHLSYLPFLIHTNEIKTKPTQHSIKQLSSMGLYPDILICRSHLPVLGNVIDKISMMCNIKRSNVFPAIDANSIYKIPSDYRDSGVDKAVLDHFDLKPKKQDFASWQNISDLIDSQNDTTIKIAIVAKYQNCAESYKSLCEALSHAAIKNKIKIKTVWQDAGDIEKEENIEKLLSEVSGIIVPGGFGIRGTEGKIKAIKFARENNIPFFGICFGAQLSVIEALRNIGGIKHATSEEIDDSAKYKAVHLMKSFIDKDGNIQNRDKNSKIGNSMRLGGYECKLKQGSKAYSIYKKEIIKERHRHRYEINIDHLQDIEKTGYFMSGGSGRIPKIFERKDHPWFIACQFHPELLSSPLCVHPLFDSFVQSAIKF